jgi:hypothetical protein
MMDFESGARVSTLGDGVFRLSWSLDWIRIPVVVKPLQIRRVELLLMFGVELSKLTKGIRFLAF